VLRAYTSDTNPYIRAIALYALGERGGLSEDILERTSRDEHGLVRGTAVGLRARAEDAAAGEVMLTVEKIVALQCVPLFASLEAPALEELAGSSIDASYAPDAPLCIQGETGDEVFVMLDGEATVVDGTRRDGPVLRIERAGSVLGEMAVLDSEPRSASVFASGQGGARVLRLNGDAFHTVVDSDPATAEGVIRSLARRIRTKEEKKPDTLGAI
jgi:CRP-like cAMP-binding protein